jgi:hypothetical protein
MHSREVRLSGRLEHEHREVRSASEASMRRHQGFEDDVPSGLRRTSSIRASKDDVPSGLRRTTFPSRRTSKDDVHQGFEDDVPSGLRRTTFHQGFEGRRSIRASKDDVPSGLRRTTFHQDRSSSTVRCEFRCPGAANSSSHLTVLELAYARTLQRRTSHIAAGWPKIAKY